MFVARSNDRMEVNMKIEESVAGVWNRMIRDNTHLVKYNLGVSYPPPFSLKDILEYYPNKDSLLCELVMSQLDYGNHLGVKGLREEICKFYPYSNPDNIVLTHGCIAANDIVIRSLYENGDNCISIAPAYQQLLSSPKAHKYEYREILLDFDEGFKLNFEELQAKVDNKTKLIIFGNPNNPAGVIFDEEELSKIIEIAKSVGAYILSDEIYKNFEYDIKIPTVFGMYEKAIATSSLSKSFGYPGLRIGWIAANAELVNDLTVIRDLSGLSVGLLDQKIAILALKEHEELNRRYSLNCLKNKKILDEWIKHNPHLSYVVPDAGVIAIVKYDFKIPSTDLCHKLLIEYGVNLLPGISFGMDDSFRIGFSCGTEEFEGGLRAIEKYFNILNKKQL